MEEDLLRARARESLLRNAARRRRNWISRKAWKTSNKGNLHIRTDGYYVTVYPHQGGWSAVISQPETGYKKFSQRRYQSVVDAQLACFDYLVFLKTKK
jgi:hypothetical protein